MVDERTSLFASSRTETSYAVPGRFTRVKPDRFNRLQFCIWTSFLAVIILAIVITIAVLVTRNNDDDQNENSLNTNPAKFMNASEFLTLMETFNGPIPDEEPVDWTLPEPDDSERNDAIEEGIIALGNREIFEENLQLVPVNTPSFRHQRAVSSTADARKLAKRGYTENYATKSLANRLEYEKRNGRHNIGIGPQIKLDTNKIVNARRCNFNSKYREPDGICNNRLFPFEYGVAYTPFRRALNPDYSDGILAPRESQTENKLPSARNVSLSVHRPSYSIDPDFTVMVAVFGQFLDHDITATALSQGQDNEPIDCCAENGEPHPECFPVVLGPGDPNYDLYNITCMNFIRSAPAPTDRFGPRQQLNQASAYIDGSVVYGYNAEKVESLRSHVGGLLRMYVTSDNRTLLPVSTDPNDGCNDVEENAKGRYCFESGDTRANENLHLTSMHLIWARHHNYIASELERINPHWNDERLFQEAKRIVAAQLQHITYNEFLPVVLGETYSDRIGLSSDPNAENDTYNETVNPSIANVFAACAFRFAHTLIPGVMNTSRDLENPNTIALHKMLFNPYSLWLAEGLDNAIGAASVTPLARSDQYFSSELTEKLFTDPNDKVQPTMAQRNVCGLDLVSLNIQRGRDHGLPAYHEFRKHCGLPSVETWEDMAFAVDADSLDTMKRIFVDAENVDVYTGALSEPPLDGAIVGPLLSCIITDQFMRLKKGDSHWYERRIGPQMFTNEQLNQIYRTSLAGIICRNSDAVDTVQRNVMKRIERDNPIVSCSEIDTFSIDAWAEEPYRRVAMQSGVSSVRTMPFVG